MTEPLVNHSIKGMKQIKGKPASVAGRTTNFFDWGAEQKAPNPSAVKRGLFKARNDIISPLKQMGINPQYMISLPCCEVNDMPNKRIHRGNGCLVDGQLAKAKTYTGMSRIAFVKSQRVGQNGMNITQKPFTFSSWSNSMCA